MKPIKAIYAVLGSGGIGLALAKELETRTKNIILVDNDATKVQTLKEQNLNAVQGNIGDTEILSSLDIQNIESVFIMSSDIEANKTALNFIRKKAPDVQIVTRVNTY
ncbi:MAG: NAD-binding protein, partial [Candidatus Methanoperedens sp.]|nr:NAD-binding protein [Candidatus Methanoperedens sp.]